MPQSTAKKQLLQEDFRLGTPVKQLVARDINSWMQTNEKQDLNTKRSQSTNAPPKFKITKRISAKHAYLNKGTQEQSQKQSPNLEELKKRRDDLMKTNSHKKWICTRTKPNSVDKQCTTGQNKKPLQWFMKLPLVHVNQFVIQENQKKDFQQITLIPEMRPFTNKNTSNVVRKLSLKKLQKRQTENMMQFSQHIQKSKRNSSIQNKNILQEKVNKNMYIGLRNSNLRKVPYLNFILNQQN